jgi:hypothetical protein
MHPNNGEGKGTQEERGRSSIDSCMSIELRPLFALQSISVPFDGMDAVDGIKQKMGRLLLPGHLEECVLDYFARGVPRYTGRFPIVLIDKTHR